MTRVESHVWRRGQMRAAGAVHNCPSAQRRDRIGFQTMRSTPTLSETRTQSLRVSEAEPDRRCCDRARVSHEESECADGHGRREEMLFSRETCRALCLGTVLTSSSSGR